MGYCYAIVRLALSIVRFARKNAYELFAPATSDASFSFLLPPGAPEREGRNRSEDCISVHSGAPWCQEAKTYILALGHYFFLLLDHSTYSDTYACYSFWRFQLSRILATEGYHSCRCMYTLSGPKLLNADCVCRITYAHIHEQHRRDMQRAEATVWLLLQHMVLWKILERWHEWQHMLAFIQNVSAVREGNWAEVLFCLHV